MHGVRESAVGTPFELKRSDWIWTRWGWGEITRTHISLVCQTGTDVSDKETGTNQNARGAARGSKHA